MAKRTVQIDEVGHQRVEEVAEHFRMSQMGATSLLVRAATDERVRELATEIAAGFRNQRGEARSRGPAVGAGSAMDPGSGEA